MILIRMLARIIDFLCMIFALNAAQFYIEQEQTWDMLRGMSRQDQRVWLYQKTEQLSGAQFRKRAMEVIEQIPDKKER